MLLAAIRLYRRPIVIITRDGAEQMVDAAQESPAERMRLGLINNNHYVSINKAILDENSDSFVAEPEQTVSDGESDKSSIQSAAPIWRRLWGWHKHHRSTATMRQQNWWFEAEGNWNQSKNNFVGLSLGVKDDILSSVGDELTQMSWNSRINSL